MTRLMIGAAALALTAGGAHAQSAEAWRSAVVDGGGLAWSLKSNDFNGRPGAARYAVYFNEGVMMGESQIQSVSRLVEVDCAARALRSIESDYVRMDGQVATEATPMNGWVTPDATSSEANLLQAWCDGAEFAGQKIHSDLDEALARIRTGQ